LPQNALEIERAKGDQASGKRFLIGAALGLFAALIAAGWLVITRLGQTRVLNGYDLVAFRYGVPAIILLPYAVRRLSRLMAYGWSAIALLVLGGGFPYGLAAVWGLRFAPVAHGGALIAGSIPTFTALFGVSILGQQLAKRQLLGLALTVIGACAIGGVGIFIAIGTQTIGHALFLLGAMLWALYTVTLRKFGIPPLDATVIVCVCSTLIYAPSYPVLLGSQIDAAPWSEILFQGFYQGILAGIVFFMAYNRAVGLLGSARAAVFLAMVPVLAALMAVPVLGEYPEPLEILGILAATAGVYFVTGARLGSA
jgi:drug/metabolite transporter (DMT)-like permease